MSISAVSGTPTEPLAGVTVADSTWPTTLMFADTVCPAATCTDAEPDKAVFGTEAVRLTGPATAGITSLPPNGEKGTNGNAPVWTSAARGLELVVTVPEAN